LKIPQAEACDYGRFIDPEPANGSTGKPANLQNANNLATGNHKL